jgi:hypothetical protein
MLERFIDRGYKLDRLTAMHAACRNCDVSVEVLELLLAQGAPISAKIRLRLSYESPQRLYTPLDLLIDDTLGHKIEIVQFLLAKGSDFDLGLLSRISNPTLRSTLERWQTCMAIVVLQELAVYYQIDASSIIDLWLYLHG